MHSTNQLLGTVRTTRAALAAALLVVSGLATSAMSQVATPPPAEVPVPKEFIPAPPPPPAPAPAQRVTPPRPTRAQPEPLPDIKYESLIKRDAQGVVQPLGEPAHFAALRVNPLVDQKIWSEIGDYLTERRRGFEQLVINHMDVIDQIENGLFDQIDFNNPESFGPVVRVTKPLTPPDAPRSLTDELRRRGSLTQQQAAFNSKIVREYSLAYVGGTLPEDAPPEVKTAHAAQAVSYLYRQTLEEPMFVYHDLLVETAGRLDQLGGMFESAEQKAAFNAAKAQLAKAGNKWERLGVMRELFSTLTVDQRKELLRKSLALRG